MLVTARHGLATHRAVGQCLSTPEDIDLLTYANSFDHPGMVGFGTCNRCRTSLGLFEFGTVSTHPKAKQISTQAMAEAVKEFEESQQQPGLFQVLLSAWKVRSNDRVDGS